MKGCVIGVSTVISLACVMSISSFGAESLYSESPATASPQIVGPPIVDGSKVTVQYVFVAPGPAEMDYGIVSEKTVSEFIQGRHQILPAVEQEVGGMKRGEEKKVELGPGEVFGPHDDRKKVNVPKSVLPFGAKEGDIFEDANGELATVAEVTERRAVLDYNHPLAGKPVVVELKILKVENP